MTRNRIALARLVLTLATILLGMSVYVSNASASSVLPLYLDQMIDQSAIAFEGTCVENRVERDPGTNLVVTYTTFAVSDVLKGSVGTTHIIKQVGGNLPDGGLQFKVEGVPTFAVGQGYVVFLAGKSTAGFSSPIGLAQGKFDVEAGAVGKRVGNGRDFKEMTSRITTQMPAAATDRLKQSAGPVRDMDLDEFKQTVRSHLGSAK